MTNTCRLSDRECIPCKGGVPPLDASMQQKLLQQLPSDWEICNQHHLKKTFTFGNFVEALAFTNMAGEISEEQNHHPEITLTWGKVTIRIWTHKVDGLTESDFILAARIDSGKVSL